MNVFNTKKVNEVDTLLQESDTIIGNFMKTASDLSLVNEKIDVINAAKQAEIDKLQSEQDSLNHKRAANQKFVEKINAFLE